MVSMLRAHLVLEPTHRVHLGQTFTTLQRGTFDPLFRQIAGPAGPVFWATAREAEVGLLVRFARTHPADLRAPIEVTIWAGDSSAGGASPASALEAFAARVPGWLGERDRWAGFYASEAWGQLPARLVRARAEAPGLAIFPQASAFAQIPDWAYHRAGFDHSRSSAMVHYANRAESFERFAAQHSASELARALNSVPGIGPWTIAETLQRYCGHPDAISVGDYHLAHHVTYAFDGTRGDDARMVELLAPYIGHRQRVVALIKAAGISEPRRGPRYAPQDMRPF